MFDKMREKAREREEETQRQEEEAARNKKERLMAMSEKELMVEMLLKMDVISKKLDQVNSSVILRCD